MVGDEYKKYLFHADARYDNDNEILYGYLEEATCGTIFEASIKSYEWTQNGRGERLALHTQHANKSKWRAILKEAEHYINIEEQEMLVFNRWLDYASFTGFDL